MSRGPRAQMSLEFTDTKRPNNLVAADGVVGKGYTHSRRRKDSMSSCRPLIVADREQRAPHYNYNLLSGFVGVEFAIGRISLLRGILWIMMRLALMSELSAGIRV